MATRTIRMIVGLGNPGEQYAFTRHNAGFLAIDQFRAEQGFEKRAWLNKHGCELIEAHISELQLCRDAARATRATRANDAGILLVKPQSFMNTCGGPVSKLSRAYKIAPEEILVLHDELDLAPDQVRIKEGGGLNAHNGLRSLSNKLQSQNFLRIQVGIGRPAQKAQVSNYVLRNLKGKQLDELMESVVRASGLLTHELERRL